MAGRIQHDYYFTPDQFDTGVKVAWTKAGNNGAPTNSLVVDGHFLALYQHPEHSWILKSVSLANWKALPDGAKFLEVKKDHVIWKPLQPGGLLPLGKIKCEEVGIYGNMYIGKTDQDGLGMVVIKHDNAPFVYMALQENGMITRTEGFLVLCAAS